MDFTADEELLRRLSFSSLTPHEARDLFAMGAWDDLEPDASVVIHDRERVRFSVILRGATDMIYRGEKISELGAGQFIGTIDLHADTLGDIDVLTRTATRLDVLASQAVAGVPCAASRRRVSVRAQRRL